MRFLVAIAAAAFASLAEAAVHPNWPVTYQMNLSTVIMTCNISGPMSDEAVTQLARYGIVDFDWSNEKDDWSNVSPMDCQERLVKQAQAIKKVNPKTKVMVYRNLVKALPWFTDVREKLVDPNYSGWFLPFKPNPPYYVSPCTGSKCSMLYHDQLQTPEKCTPECDCGEGIPCGEYLFDHRNESLRQWLIETFIKGDLANEAVDGYYIDDSWVNTQSATRRLCDGNPHGGPTEEDYHCVADMNLSNESIDAITAGWQESFAAAHTAIVAANGWSWRLFTTVFSPNITTCSSFMRGRGMQLANETVMWTHDRTLNGTQAEFDADIAMFLLTRGDYAWLGYLWNGCHSKWMYRWSEFLDRDYGVPVKAMVETSTGVFQREWSKAVVEMDCNQYKPSFQFKD